MPVGMKVEDDAVRLLYSEVNARDAALVDARFQHGTWRHSSPLRHPLNQYASVSAFGEDLLVALNPTWNDMRGQPELRLWSNDTWTAVEAPPPVEGHANQTAPLVLANGQALFVAERYGAVPGSTRTRRTYLKSATGDWRPIDDWTLTSDWELFQSPTGGAWLVEHQYRARSVTIRELVADAWVTVSSSLLPDEVEFIRSVFISDRRVFGAAVERGDPDYRYAIYELTGETWSRVQGTAASDYYQDQFVFDATRNVVWVGSLRSRGGSDHFLRLIRRDADGNDSQIDIGQNVVTRPTIALDSEGDPLVAWSESTQQIYESFGERHSRCSLEMRRLSSDLFR